MSWVETPALEPARLCTAAGHVAENSKFWRSSLAAIRPTISSDKHWIPRSFTNAAEQKPKTFSLSCVMISGSGHAVAQSHLNSSMRQVVDRWVVSPRVANLWHETHIQHAISFIQHKVAHASKTLRLWTDENIEKQVNTWETLSQNGMKRTKQEDPFTHSSWLWLQTQLFK